MDSAGRWQQAAVSAWLCLWFVLVYNGCNYLASQREFVGTCAYDWELNLFPFLPILIIPYWSIDLFFVLAPFLIKQRFELGQHLKRVTFGIAVAGFFFLFFPLQLVTPAPPVQGWLQPFFGALENFNNFYNCAPSLHIVLRINLLMIYLPLCRGRWRWVLGAWFFLIGISTLFCYQHHLMDVITGQLLGLFCLWLFPSVRFQPPHRDPGQGINARPRIGYYYGATSGFLVLLTVAGWPESVLLLWPALALFVVAGAYLGGGPTWLRKDQGKQLPGARMLLAPYHWSAALSALYFNSGRKPYRELRPGILLGRRLAEAEAAEIDVEAVLDLTAEYEEAPSFLTKAYLNIPILDLTSPSLEQLQAAVGHIQGHSSCYIHCSLGRGRTATVAIAYLISQGSTLAEALDEVTRLQPELRLAPGAWEVLQQYELRSA
ncbi:MAG: dual specificity protein phosphatase family protein [Vulcanimicrobiota bacterium]